MNRYLALFCIFVVVNGAAFLACSSGGETVTAVPAEDDTTSEPAPGEDAASDASSVPFLDASKGLP
jgi:hypothetical protein